MSSSSKGPLGYATFRRAVAARVISSAGTWMQAVAAAWLIYNLTQSAVAVGVLSACARGPAIAFSAYGGVLADRFDRRRLTIVLYAVQAIPAFVLAVLSWAGAAGLFELYALTLVIGIAGAVSSPALQEIVTGTVPAALAGRATAINAASYNVARLIGPAAAGGLLAVAGPGLCFAVNGASFLAVVLAAVTLPDQAGRSPGKAVAMRSAATRVLSHPVLRAIFPVVLLFSLVVGPVQELAAALAHRYGGGAHLLGLLLSALAVGGLAAVPVRSLLVKREVATADALGGSLVLASASLLLLAASPNFAVAALAMVLCGLGWDVVYILGLTGMQTADKKMSGLLTGFFFTAAVGGTTIGALLVGGLFDVVGIPSGLTVCSAVVALAGLWTLGARRLGRAVEKVFASGLRRAT